MRTITEIVEDIEKLQEQFDKYGIDRSRFMIIANSRTVRRYRNLLFGDNYPSRPAAVLVRSEVPMSINGMEITIDEDCPQDEFVVIDKENYERTSKKN